MSAVSNNPQWETVKDLCAKLKLEMTPNVVLVNIASQTLDFVVSQKILSSYPVSTAVKGAGQEEGTGRTPLGLHRIEEKIGDDVAPLAIFKSRGLTGELAKPNVGEASIVGRILWLKGLQEGFNSGKNGAISVDSYNRYIYIHGTNDLANIGKPASGGCIRMNPDDVVKLYDQVSEKTLVYIFEKL
jgi:lipoprotein-anchoring transpeptidase ErfK/SrfK